MSIWPNFKVKWQYLKDIIVTFLYIHINVIFLERINFDNIYWCQILNNLEIFLRIIWLMNLCIIP